MQVYRSENRGKADYGWLNARYSFSFAGYYNPENIHFGVLRVLNDDIIQAGMGFDTHPHDNMEIITIPLQGALRHNDSMGHESVITSGEVQVMSAGTGIRHSEFNASDRESLNLFQIWIFPYRKGLQPRYDQKKFETETGKSTLLVSPDGRDGSLQINQNAFISRLKVEAGNAFNYELFDTGNGIFLMVIDGEVEVQGEKLFRRDALSGQFDELEVLANKNSELLILEVPL